MDRHCPILFLFVKIYNTNFIVLAEGKEGKRAVAKTVQKVCLLVGWLVCLFVCFNERGLNILKFWSEDVDRKEGIEG